MFFINKLLFNLITHQVSLKKNNIISLLHKKKIQVHFNFHDTWIIKIKVRAKLKGKKTPKTITIYNI